MKMSHGNPHLRIENSLDPLLRQLFQMQNDTSKSSGTNSWIKIKIRFYYPENEKLSLRLFNSGAWNEWRKKSRGKNIASVCVMWFKQFIYNCYFYTQHMHRNYF